MGDVTIDMDLVTRWIEALESGEYKQGTVRLLTNGAYCCLGVLCDVKDHSRWVGESWGIQTAGLPDDLADEVGLEWDGRRPDRSLWRFPNLHSESLTTGNDRGASFLDIAAALREHYGLPPREVTP